MDEIALMEELFLTYVPDFYDQLTSFLVSLGAFFAGGVLIAFVAWVIGFTVREIFGWLSNSGEGV